MAAGSHIFSNIKFEFIECFLVITRTSLIEFKIYGTHELTRNNWENVEFTCIQQKDHFRLELIKYSNFSYFKIDFYGEEVEYKNIVFKRHIPKNILEIKKFLKSKKATFLGCARDCETSIGDSIKIIQYMGSFFGSFSTSIIENDSRDGTAKVLNSANSQINLTLHTFRNFDTFFLKRTERLSFCRNFLLNLSKTIQSDYVIVIDLDGIVKDVSETGFLSNFAFADCWDACFPVSNPYYDLWAFRHSSILPADYYEHEGKFPAVIGPENILRLKAIPIRNLHFQTFKGWLEVDSAFGGVGIYKTDLYHRGKYFGLKNNKEICEHVIFHQTLKAIGAKLYINPNFNIS